MSDAPDRPATGTQCAACGYTSARPSQRCPSCGARRTTPTGSPLPPPIPGTHVADTPPYARRRLLVAGAALLLVVGVGAYALSGGDSDDRFGSSSARVSIPEQLEEAWTREFDGPGSATVLGERVIVAFTPNLGPTTTVSAFDKETNEEQWSIDLEDASWSRIVSTDPLVLEWLGGGTTSAHLVRLSPDDGAVLWDVGIAPGRAQTIGDELYVIPKYLDPSNPQDIREMSLVDVEDGTVSDPVTAELGLSLVGNELVAHDDDSITVYDPHTLTARGGPIPIDDDARVVTLWGDLAVSGETDQLTATDRAGRALWTVDSPVDTVLSLMPIGDLLVVNGDEGVAAVRRSPDGIDEVWRIDGAVENVLPQFELLVVRTGTVLRFIDIDSGEARMTVSRVVANPGSVQGFSNGVVVRGIDGSGYRAFLLPDFEPGWDINGGNAVITADGIVAYERHGDGDDIPDDTMTVTVYR